MSDPLGLVNPQHQTTCYSNTMIREKLCVTAHNATKQKERQNEDKMIKKTINMLKT